jgi:hypothetical protein
VLVLMTDGADTCDGDPVNGPEQAVTDLFAENKANPVQTYVVGLAFQNGDPAVGVLNTMAANGGTKTARFANDQVQIEAALADMVAASVKVEVCNNKDDNCNALVDEGFDKGAKCATGVGACARSGIKKCDAMNNTQTVCCVDDGNPNGACVALKAGAPAKEICNGKDDDCNGIVDDNAPGAPTWYADSDGDTYGNLASTVQACTASEKAPAGTHARIRGWAVLNELPGSQAVLPGAPANRRRAQPRCIAPAATKPDQAPQLRQEKASRPPKMPPRRRSTPTCISAASHAL